MTRAALIFITLIIFPLVSLAQIPVRWHNEARDTVVVEQLLMGAAALGQDNPGQAAAYAANSLLGATYKRGTLEESPEMVTVNLNEVDGMTLVENVAAIALTARERRTSWRDFVRNLQSLRYRGGEVDGYPSRLHYVTEWIVDNGMRGNLKDVTSLLPKCDHRIRTIDHMSRNLSDYPALTDSATLQGIKDTEVGFHSHRFPFIKRQNISNPQILSQLRDGDIAAFTTRTDDLGIGHMGVIVIIDGVPRLIHASETDGKVVLDPLPLAEYLRKSQNLDGVRIFRVPRE